jgi:coproporphyrinogen III oxidase-like Fe-S oxidoreductase
VQADRYLVAEEMLAAAGFGWYEVSNWARPGEECRHNLLYWGEGDYLAIGCAAHGHTDGRRWWNVRTPERYIAAIEGGVSAVAGDERLEPGPRAEEACALALRTRTGSRVADEAAGVVDELAAAGFVRRVADRVVLTTQGRLLASDVTARLLLAGAVGTR